MPELRWILLGLGVLFCLGLWWWESRRGRQAADSRASLKPGEGLTVAPSLREPPRQAAIEAPETVRELSPWDEPPVAEEVPKEIDVEFEFEPAPLPAAADSDSRNPVSRGLGRIEPIFGDPSSVVGPAPMPSAPAPRAPLAEKIITLRVAAPPLERFEGSLLVRALENAGLEHGKFSIFHKITPEGATLFSVASLVEPGTFDLASVAGRRFPGVSLFAVLTNEGDAGGVLEEMVAAARSLAASVHGMVQDERGAPLNPQRLAELRAEVFAWMREHPQSDGASPG